jgi:DNA-binding protein H-NS
MPPAFSLSIYCGYFVPFGFIIVLKGAGGHTMNEKLNLDLMSSDEIWQLHENISEVLSLRLTSEKQQLEKRLEQLRRDPGVSSSGASEIRAQRRKYAPVAPKYQNSQHPHETWSGRGKTPRWLVAALKKGHKVENFAINTTSQAKE